MFSLTNIFLKDDIMSCQKYDTIYTDRFGEKFSKC